MPEEKSTVERLWEQYDPVKDKDLKEFRINSRISWMEQAAERREFCKRVEKIESRVKIVESKIDAADVTVRTGYGLVKGFMYFTAEAIVTAAAAASIIYPIIRMAVK